MEFSKNLNKSVYFDKNSKNSKKVEKLKEIEKFFFPDMKELIIIDLNPKIYIEQQIPHHGNNHHNNNNNNNNNSNNIKNVPKF